MSRVMEIVCDDPTEIVAKRARKAFVRIGKIDAYDAEKSLRGRVGIDGYTAYLTVEWVPHKDRIRVDIRARSDDELSRAADQSMYRFLDAFKHVRPEDLDKPDPKIKPKTLGSLLAGAAILVYVVIRLMMPH